MVHDNINRIKKVFPDLYIDTDSENFQVKMKSPWLGCQLCPFVNKDQVCVTPNKIPNYADRDFIITNKLTGETLEVNLLIPHLIYYHHFYEGHVPHRISPTKLINFFGLSKEV